MIALPRPTTSGGRVEASIDRGHNPPLSFACATSKSKHDTAEDAIMGGVMSQDEVAWLTCGGMNDGSIRSIDDDDAGGAL
jgi:hypothetical protein